MNELEKPWRLYVNGQMGLPFESQSDALQAAKSFEEEGFDCYVIQVIEVNSCLSGVDAEAKNNPEVE